MTAGREQAALLVRAADRAGDQPGGGQAAHAVRHLLLHHQELPVLQDGGQGLAELHQAQSQPQQVGHELERVGSY